MGQDFEECHKLILDTQLLIAQTRLSLATIRETRRQVMATIEASRLARMNRAEQEKPG